MDSQSNKFLQLLINNKIDILNDEKDLNFSLVSINIDTGSLDVNDNPENYEYKNEIMKKTEKVIFLTCFECNPVDHVASINFQSFSIFTAFHT